MSPHSKCPKCGVVQLSPGVGVVCARCASLAGDVSTTDTNGPTQRLAADSQAGRHAETGRPLIQLRDYELLSEVARGGMGIVFKARQISLNRTVAVKVIRSGRIAGGLEIQRFLIEAKAAATLQHPHIVAIHEIGQDAGEHFFSMDFVEGQSLGELVRAQPLSPRESATLVKKIAEAIHYAHQRGILHRDLKPSNVLVDANRQPRITDFGLAKLMSEESDLTISGMVMGSPSYMPPEQAEGRAADVTVRSDIYSIGAILYYLLTGKPPFLADSPLGTIKLVVETEVTPPRQINPKIPRDLETICLKCLEKNPAQRFGAAQETADDLERFLNYQSIHSRANGLLERAWRWCRRKPAVATALLIFICGFIGVFWQWRRAEALAANEIVLRRDAEQASVDALLSEARITRLSGLAGHRDHSLAALAKAARLQPGPAIRDEIIACLPLVDLRAARSWAANVRSSTVLAFDSHLGFFASANESGEIALGEADGREAIALPTGMTAIGMLKLSLDGRLIAAGTEGGFAVWEVASRRTLLAASNFTGSVSLDLSPDGRRIAVGDASGAIRIYEIDSGQAREFTFSIRRPCGVIRYDPGGERLAVSSPDSLNLFVVHVATGEEITLPHPGEVADADWHPSGKFVATACSDHQVYVWDWKRGKSTILRGHTAPPTHVAFAHHGYNLASSGEDKTLRIWDAATGRPLVRSEGVTVATLRFSPDDQKLAATVTEGTSGQIQLLDVTWPKEVRFLQDISSDARVNGGAAFSRDGEFVAVPGDEGIHLWDLPTGVILDSIRMGNVQAVGITADSNDLIVRGFYGLHRLPIARAQLREDPLMLVGPPRFFDHAPGEGAMVVSPSGQIILAENNRLLLLDAARDGVSREVPTQPGIQTLAASPDDNWIAAGNWETREVAVWDKKGNFQTNLPVHGRAHLGFSQDGRWLATATESECQIWRVGPWTPEPSLRRARSGARPGPIAFSPDGAHFAWTTGDAKVSLTSVKDGRTLLSIKSPSAANINLVQFTPDGGGLLIAADGAPLSLWDLGSLRDKLAIYGLLLDAPVSSSIVRPPVGRPRPRLLSDLHKIEYTQQARADLQKLEAAVRTDPGNGGAWKTLATIAADFHHLPRALHALNQALRIQPDDTGSLLQRAFLLIKLHRFSEAIDDYKRVIVLDERNPFPAQQLAHLYLQVPGDHRDTSLGGRYARMALRIDPENPVNLFWSGVAEYRSGAFQNALEFFERARSFNPDATTFRLYQAMALAKLGQSTAAAAAFDAALKLLEFRSAYVQSREHFDLFVDEARSVCMAAHPK